MSAIAGIFYFDRAPVEPGLIEKLTSAMKSRGPDEQTHWVKDSVALGHCMLRTTPESLAEHQPLTSQDKNLVMVWDGRLDNREELQRDLKAADVTLRDGSDAELVLQSFTVWGKECPKKLLGDFVFAIWDVRQNELFCVRDHMGARPFYYTLNSQFFAFASEEEVLAQLPGVSSLPNEGQIASLLVPRFQNSDNPLSFLRDVWGLPPGHAMMLAPDGTSRTDIFWRLEPGEESYYATDKECEEAFLDVFGAAVRCRMRSTGDIAAMMSGGLDSASIAAMVKRLLPEMPGKNFHTYSAISDHPKTCVESQCIQTLTKDLAGSAHFVSVPSFTGMVDVQDLIEITWSKPHPVDNTISLQAAMCLAASRHGNRVLLHGATGDLTMDVPIHYSAYYLRAGKLLEAWQECKAASRYNTYLQGSSPLYLLLRGVEFAFVPGTGGLLKKPARQLLGRTPLAQSVISPKFARKMKLAERLRSQNKENNCHAGDTPQQAHARLLNSLTRGPVVGLAGCERVAGRYGIELRDPWADRRVVEFFLRLPLTQKVHNGWTKHLARTAFKSDLDTIVKQRLGKEHLGWQFITRVMDETEEFVTHLLTSQTVNVAGYVDIAVMQQRLNKYRISRGDLDRLFVYEMASFVSWLNRLYSNECKYPKLQ